jgi:N-acetylglucosamine malate deacetylase 1
MFQNKKILIVGAHPDDFEFGLGGLLSQLDNKNNLGIIFCTTENFNGVQIIEELKNSMSVFNLPFRLRRDIINMNFINQKKEINQILFDVKTELKPDIIFCTSRNSHNPDHKVLADSVLAVFQEQTILFYETVRGDYDHKPNFYVKIDKYNLETKQKAISQYVSPKALRKYMDISLVEAQARFRGSQIGEEYAEAFEVGRIVN